MKRMVQYRLEVLLPQEIRMTGLGQKYHHALIAAFLTAALCTEIGSTASAGRAADDYDRSNQAAPPRQVCAAHCLNVRAFGALGDGKADDTVAVQAAINSAATGDTVLFPAGAYRITSTLRLRSGLTYQGADQPVLLGYQAKGPHGYPLAQISGAVKDIVVTGITFDGGGAVFEARDVTGSNVAFVGNTVTNIQNTNDYGDMVNHSGLTFLGIAGWTKIRISHNRFTDITWGGKYLMWVPALNSDYGTAGIVVSRPLDYQITDNVFVNIAGNGMSFPQTYDFPRVLHGPFNILRNAFYQIHRIAIETQQGQDGFCVQDMHVDNNHIYSFIAPYWGAWAYRCLHGAPMRYLPRTITSSSSRLPAPRRRLTDRFRITELASNLAFARRMET